MKYEKISQYSSEVLDYSYLYNEAHRKKSIIEQIRTITLTDIGIFLLEISQAIVKVSHITYIFLV